MLRRHRGRVLTWALSLTLATSLLSLTPYAGLPDSSVSPAVAADAVHDPNFPYFVAVTTDQAAVAKSGAFGAQWVNLYGPAGVLEAAITSDRVHGTSTALRFKDGSVLAKTGGLTTGWTWIQGPITQMAIASHPTGPAKLLTVKPNGDLFGRQGIDKESTFIRGNVMQVAAAGDDRDGVSIVVVDTNGDVLLTNDPQKGGWAKLFSLGSADGAQVDVASNPVTGQTFAVRDRAGVAHFHIGPLQNPWTKVVSPVPIKQVAVASDSTNGPAVLVLREDGSVARVSDLAKGTLTTIYDAKPVTEIFAASDPTDGLFVAVLATDGQVQAYLPPNVPTFHGFLGGAAQLTNTTPVVLPPTPTAAPKPTASAPAPTPAATTSVATPTQPPVTTQAPNRIMLLKRPVVAGKRRPGQRLTVRTMDFIPTDCKVRYRWLRNRKPIRKATSSAYGFTRKDVGKKLTVRITFSHPGLDPLVQIVTVQRSRKRRL